MTGLLIAFLLAGPGQTRVDQLIEQIARSGRAVESITDDRLRDPTRQVAPGAPPLLAFRYFEGAERHRFGNLDLTLDDAGH